MSDQIKQEEQNMLAPKIEETIKEDVVSVSTDDMKKLLEIKNSQLDQFQLKMNEMTIKLNNLERDLQQRTEERENYKNKIHSLETEISEVKNKQPNILSPAQQVEVDKVKIVSEDMLTRAKGIIFDKTKVCKHQELQIEALTQQVTSLKEVLGITKELLEIRNMEVKHLEEKMNCMDMKFTAEKHRHDLMNKKMDAMVQMNTDLKGEYETQLRLFNELRTSYAEKDDLQKNNES